MAKKPKAPKLTLVDADAKSEVDRLWRGGEKFRALLKADAEAIPDSDRPDGMADFAATVR